MTDLTGKVEAPNHLEEKPINFKNTWRDLILIFLVAVALRLIYVELAISSIGFDKFVFFANDTRLYLLTADHILSPNNNGSYGLLRVGPGYALILAGIKSVFGPNLIWPIMFSVLMGALAPVFVYLLGLKLFASRTIGIIAGIFSAVSFTSLSASAHILTDQTFFTFHIAELVSFVHACQTKKLKWFVAAGLIAGFVSYIRSVGIIWPYIFIFMSLVIPLGAIYKSRVELVRRAAITGIVMLVLIWGWSARNYFIHDKFVFGTNGMLTIRSCLIAQAAERSWGEGRRIVEYREIWEAEDGDRSENFVPAYDKAKARVVAELKRNLSLVVSCYMHNLLENMTAGNGYITREILPVSSFAITLNTAVEKWLGYLIIVLTVIGFVLMYRLNLKLPFWILGSTYLAFSVLLGASFWQGSRLHYPAEMAWPLVLAFLVVWTTRKIKDSTKVAETKL